MENQSAIVLPPLPYAQDALEPHISARIISFHYDKHHRTYVDNTNKFIAGTELAGKSLEQIVAATAGKADKVAIFNNAAQVWNHTFYWKSMQPKGGGGVPKGALEGRIGSDFGSYDNFVKEFSAAAVGQFGSGWAWLVEEGGKLKVAKTSNAEMPQSKKLMVCDVWEHAYYLDYQNKRADYVKAFIDHLINWEFVAANLAGK